MDALIHAWPLVIFVLGVSYSLGKLMSDVSGMKEKQTDFKDALDRIEDRLFKGR